MTSKKVIHDVRRSIHYERNLHWGNRITRPGDLIRQAGKLGILGYIIDSNVAEEHILPSHDPDDNDNSFEESSLQSKRQKAEGTEDKLRESREEGGDEHLNDPQPKGQWAEGTEDDLDESGEEEEDEHLSDLGNSDDEDACWKCGSTRGWARLIQCSYCREYVHIECYNEETGSSLKGTPRGLFACHGVDVCKKTYLKLVEDGKINDYLDLVSSKAPKSHRNVQLKGSSFVTMDNDTDSDSGDHNDNSSNQGLYCKLTPTGVNVRYQSYLEEASTNLLDARKSNPIKFLAAEEYCRNLKSLDPNAYMGILALFGTELDKVKSISSSEKDALMDLLRGKKPPQNIRRFLESCGNGGIETQTLTHHFRKQGVEAFWVMNRFRPIEVALDLYRSALTRSRGPFHKASRSRCSTGRMPDDFVKLEQFAATMGFDCHDPSNLTLQVGFYSDDSRSASGNVEFCPLWLSLTSMDPLVRFIERELAHGLVCFLPDQASIQYRFNGRGHTGSDGLAETVLTKAQKYKAYLDLREQALQWMCEDIKRDEVEGLPYVLDGKEVRVRLLVTWYIADMKERRMLLGMLRSSYHCCRCYAFPGKPNDTEKCRGPRTQIEDSSIREEMRNGQSGSKKKFNIEEGVQKTLERGVKLLGIPEKDQCPFTSTKKASIFTCQGPYELFNFDALHHKDGLITYFVKFLQMRLGEDLVTQSEQFGNVYLLTKKLSMHVMERGLESYHFIPLTIIFGNFPEEISMTERTELFLCACDLLQIIALLADPCPGFILEKLKATIKVFASRLQLLLDNINRSNNSMQCITPKMHELIAHVVDQVHQMGLPDAYSTKVYETMHQSLKELFLASSKHSNGKAFREVLLTTFFRRVMDEAKRQLNVSAFAGFEFGAPWKSVIRFHIAQPQGQVSRLSISEFLRTNVNVVFSTVFRTSCPQTFLESFWSQTNIVGFGTTLYMQVQCALRNQEETENVVAVVPGTAKGRFFEGGTFNALAFREPEAFFNDENDDQSDVDGNKMEVDYRSCPVNGCQSRHHDDEFEYACSAARDGNTSYGLPVGFFSSTAVVLPLYPVTGPECTIPYHPAVLDVRCETSIRFVSFKSIRGICLYRPNDSKLSEFRGFLFTGRGVFGHRSECEH